MKPDPPPPPPPELTVWQKLNPWYQPDISAHAPPEPSRTLLARIAQGWNKTEFIPKVDLIEGIGGERLRNLGPEVLVGIIGFQACCWLEWIPVVMLCIRFKPITMLISHRAAPESWRVAHGHFMKSADATLEMAVQRCREIPVLRQFMPKRIADGMGVGFLEGNVVYYAMMPFFIPANFFILEYSLARWYGRSLLTMNSVVIDLINILL